MSKTKRSTGKESVAAQRELTRLRGHMQAVIERIERANDARDVQMIADHKGISTTEARALIEWREREVAECKAIRERKAQEAETHFDAVRDAYDKQTQERDGAFYIDRAHKFLTDAWEMARRMEEGGADAPVFQDEQDAARYFQVMSEEVSRMIELAAPAFGVILAGGDWGNVALKGGDHA